MRNQSELVVAQVMLTILKNDQTRRLKEIVLQQAAGGQGFFFGSILTLDPKLADELKLTAEQKAKLQQGGGFGIPRQVLADLLTDEQKKKWTDIAGKPFELDSGRGVPPGFPLGSRRRSTAFLTFSLRGVLQYLDDPAIQKDLTLTDAQKKKVAELNKMASGTIVKVAGLMGRSGTNQTGQRTRDQLTKELGEMLTAAQAKRLKQLRFQFSMSMQGGGGAGGPAMSPLQPINVLVWPLAVSSLKLSEEQTAQIQKGAERRTADIGTALLSDAKIEDIEKKIAKLNEKANTDALAMLTDGQKRN